MIIDNDWVTAETPEEAEQLQFGSIRKEDEYLMRVDYLNGIRSWSSWSTDYPRVQMADHMRACGFIARRPRHMFDHLGHTESIHFI
jgi:hypothetical protein